MWETKDWHVSLSGKIIRWLCRKLFSFEMSKWECVCVCVCACVWVPGDVKMAVCLSVCVHAFGCACILWFLKWLFHPLWRFKAPVLFSGSMTWWKSGWNEYVTHSLQLNVSFCLNADWILEWGWQNGGHKIRCVSQWHLGFGKQDCDSDNNSGKFSSVS